MKKINILLFVCLFAVAMCLSLGAAELLSPAIGVMQSEVRLIKTSVGENAVTFSPYDFDSVLGIQAGSVAVTKLPEAENGLLKLGEADVLPGQIIPRESMEKLTLIPTGENEAVFCFSIPESGYENSFECIAVPLKKLNFAPAASASEITAKENISVFAKLTANDPEEDEIIFHITKNARHGNVTVVSRETGEIKYTPDKGFYGKDKFTFTAVDKYGNESAPATVKIKVEKNSGDISYSDMKNNDAHTAAVILAEKDIFSGEKLGDMRTFSPEKEISRADFLIMAMRASDIEKSASDVVSGFEDDPDFTAYQRRYIASAEKAGIVYGFETENGAVFRPNESITLAHAATVIGRIAAMEKYDTDESISVFADEKSEITEEGMDTLAAIGVFAEADGEKLLTRAEAAKLLLYMMGNK